MDHVARLGAGTPVRIFVSTSTLQIDLHTLFGFRNVTSPRIASSSKDGSVRVWNAKLRKLEFSLGGHTASVNVVRWGGEGVIYTASSDRTVKLWDGKDVSRNPRGLAFAATEIDLFPTPQGKLIRTLSEHAHWVNTMALNTDFILRTGPYDQNGKVPSSDEEGWSFSFPFPPRKTNNFLQPKPWLLSATRPSPPSHPSSSSPAQTTTHSSSGLPSIRTRPRSRSRG